MSGAIFNLVFTFVSFSVLWFQPADAKSFFISLLIAAGAWWTNLIAQTIDKAKLAVYGHGFNESKLAVKITIVSDMLLRLIAVIIGLFLFWLSLMGTMGFLDVNPDSIVVANASIDTSTNIEANTDVGANTNTEAVIPTFLAKVLPKISLDFLFWANIIALVLSLLILALQPILETKFYSLQQYRVLSDKLKATNNSNIKYYQITLVE